jgi:superfamily II DNA or RNA helicase
MKSERADERFLVLEPNPIQKRPHDHQRAAWDALSRHFDGGGRAGLLVIPTGGGKTFVTAHWLLEHHVRAGGRVLWLAHRRNLLVQAMDEFEQLRNVAHPRPRLGLLRISSKDSSWSRVDGHCDVVFSSLQTAIRSENRGFIEHFMSESEGGVVVVVDEAHHAAAPAYARLVRWMRERGARLVGLTATPVRVDDDDERRLHALFDSKLVYQVSRRELTERGFLAAPVFETVKTEIGFERDFSDEDFEYLRRFGELGPGILHKLSSHSARNNLIAKRYAERQHEYGPTIMFAVDTYHAKTLADELCRIGIDADYVDYTRSDAPAVMEGYRQRRQPAVLVNVEMLTEGFDAPHTRTVFIARPTRSEGLLMQMVGRALRGPVAGGNDLAYLVTFLDTWQNFDVLDAQYVLEGGAIDVPEPTEREPRGPLVPVPYELVIEAYRLLQSVTRGDFVGVHQCLPFGWYAWEQIYDNDLQRRVVLVFENQRDGYEALLARFDATDPIALPLHEDAARGLVREHFGDLPDPLPRWQDLLELLLAKRDGADVLFYSFEDKKAFDPRELARSRRERNLGENEFDAELQALWTDNPTLRHVYRDDFQTWNEEVHREQMALRQPAKPPAPPVLVDMVPKAPPRPWPPGEFGYSLVRIKDAVVASARNFPNEPPQISELRWSRDPMRSLWGFCRYADKQIRINCILNSPDVPLFALEFLVYHELLHAEMPHEGHGREFRLREHGFEPSLDAIVEAKSRGLEPGKSRDAWRVLADQFFDTFDRHYQHKRPGEKVRL